MDGVIGMSVPPGTSARPCDSSLNRPVDGSRALLPACM